MTTLRVYVEHSDSAHDYDETLTMAPDVADAIVSAIINDPVAEPPRHAHTFEDLTAAISQTSRLIQRLEAFRELAMVMADETSPHADRKAIAIAAAMPPSRLYRVLEKHGQPRDRKAQPANRTAEK